MMHSKTLHTLPLNIFTFALTTFYDYDYLPFNPFDIFTLDISCNRRLTPANSTDVCHMHPITEFYPFVNDLGSHRDYDNGYLPY